MHTYIKLSSTVLCQIEKSLYSIVTTFKSTAVHDINSIVHFLVLTHLGYFLFLPGHRKRLRCWCWVEPLSSPQELSRGHEPSQSWWHGANWRGGLCQGTSCHGNAPQCKVPGTIRISMSRCTSHREYKSSNRNIIYQTSSSLCSWIWLSKPNSIRYSTMHRTCSDMFWWSIHI